MENTFQLLSIDFEYGNYKGLIINILKINSFSLFTLNISNEYKFTLHEFQLTGIIKYYKN